MTGTSTLIVNSSSSSWWPGSSTQSSSTTYTFRKGIWQWLEFPPNIWTDFDSATSKEIEQNLMQNITNNIKHQKRKNTIDIALTKGKYFSNNPRLYTVRIIINSSNNNNNNSMRIKSAEQINNQTHFKRKMRRVPPLNITEKTTTNGQKKNGNSRNHNNMNHHRKKQNTKSYNSQSCVVYEWYDVVPGRWKEYDLATCMQIEDAYANHEKLFKLNCGPFFSDPRNQHYTLRIIFPKTGGSGGCGRQTTASFSQKNLKTKFLRNVRRIERHSPPHTVSHSPGNIHNQTHNHQKNSYNTNNNNNGNGSSHHRNRSGSGGHTYNNKNNNSTRTMHSSSGGSGHRTGSGGGNAHGISSSSVGSGSGSGKYGSSHQHQKNCGSNGYKNKNNNNIFRQRQPSKVYVHRTQKNESENYTTTTTDHHSKWRQFYRPMLAKQFKTLDTKNKICMICFVDFDEENLLQNQSPSVIKTNYNNINTNTNKNNNNCNSTNGSNDSSNNNNNNNNNRTMDEGGDSPMVDVHGACSLVSSKSCFGPSQMQLQMTTSSGHLQRAQSTSDVDRIGNEDNLNFLDIISKNNNKKPQLQHQKQKQQSSEAKVEKKENEAVIAQKSTISGSGSGGRGGDAQFVSDMAFVCSKVVDDTIVCLSKCAIFDHYFHASCANRWLKQKGKCSHCFVRYATQTGNQPSGLLNYQLLPKQSVSGHPNCGGMIRMTFEFQGGFQNESHPNPGVRYSSESRNAYLPNNSTGREALELTKIAFERRLIFTVGTSLTTKKDNRIIWTSIHFKTRQNGGEIRHGWPDETYFERFKEELKAKGVTIADLNVDAKDFIANDVWW